MVDQCRTTKDFSFVLSVYSTGLLLVHQPGRWSTSVNDSMRKPSAVDSFDISVVVDVVDVVVVDVVVVYNSRRI